MRLSGCTTVVQYIICQQNRLAALSSRKTGICIKGCYLIFSSIAMRIILGTTRRQRALTTHHRRHYCRIGRRKRSLQIHITASHHEGSQGSSYSPPAQTHAADWLDIKRTKNGRTLNKRLLDVCPQVVADRSLIVLQPVSQLICPISLVHFPYSLNSFLFSLPTVSWLSDTGMQRNFP